MPEICAYDRSNPLLRGETLGGRYVTTFEPITALRICEMVAEGKTMNEIFTEENRGVVCSKRTWFSWVMNYKDCAFMYNAARAISAYELEDLALQELKTLKDMPGSPQKVAAYRALVDQYRWSAGRRNPTVFSEKAPVNLTVPIQINTTLDLGLGDGAAKAPNANTSVYDLTARVPSQLPPVLAEDDEESVPFKPISAAAIAAPRMGRPPKQALTPKGPKKS